MMRVPLICAVALLVLVCGCVASEGHVRQLDERIKSSVAPLRRLTKELRTSSFTKSRALSAHGGSKLHVCVNEADGDDEVECEANDLVILALDRPAFPFSRMMWEITAIEEICGDLDEDDCESFGNGNECTFEEGEGEGEGECSPSPVNFMCKDSLGYNIFTTVDQCGMFGFMDENGFPTNGSATGCSARTGCAVKSVDLTKLVEAANFTAPDGFEMTRNLCVSEAFNDDMLAEIVEMMAIDDDDEELDDEELEELVEKLLGDCEIAKLMNRVGIPGLELGENDLDDLSDKCDFANETACEAAAGCTYMEVIDECLTDEDATFLTENFDPYVMRAFASADRLCESQSTDETCTAETVAYSADFLDAKANGSVVTMNDDSKTSEATAPGFDVTMELSYPNALSSANMIAIENQIRVNLDSSCANVSITCPVQVSLSATGTTTTRRSLLAQTYDLQASGRYDTMEEASAAADKLNAAADDGNLKTWASVTGADATITRKEYAEAKTVGGNGASGQALVVALVGVVALLMAALA